MSSSLSYRVRNVSTGDMKLIKKIIGKIETNVRMPHPTLVVVGMGIGISMLAVLVLTAIDVSFLGQEAEAALPRGRSVRESDMN
jgi:hypothetical protein